MDGFAPLVIWEGVYCSRYDWDTTCCIIRCKERVNKRVDNTQSVKAWHATYIVPVCPQFGQASGEKGFHGKDPPHPIGPNRLSRTLLHGVSAC